VLSARHNHFVENPRRQLSAIAVREYAVRSQAGAGRLAGTGLRLRATGTGKRLPRDEQDLATLVSQHPAQESPRELGMSRFVFRDAK
jgi:hypothetical protein